MAHGARLPGDSAAIEAGSDIELLQGIGELHRLFDVSQNGFRFEIGLGIGAVADPFTGARDQTNPGDGGFPAAGRVECGDFFGHDGASRLGIKGFQGDALMGMGVPAINLEALEHLAGNVITGEHTLDGMFDDPLRLGGP